MMSPQILGGHVVGSRMSIFFDASLSHWHIVMTVERMLRTWKSLFCGE